MRRKPLLSSSLSGGSWCWLYLLFVVSLFLVYSVIQDTTRYHGRFSMGRYRGIEQIPFCLYLLRRLFCVTKGDTVQV